MTVSEMKQTKRPFLTPAEVAEVLRCDPQAIRVMARQRPELLGFPVTVIKSRTKIPRQQFLRYIGEES